MKILLSNPYGLKTKGKFFNKNSITNQNMKMYQYCKIQYILSNKYMISHEEKKKKTLFLGISSKTLWCIIFSNLVSLSLIRSYPQNCKKHSYISLS